MNEVKIQIPDNCELIKDGDTYIVKKKKKLQKKEPPRSWEEFCKNYSRTTNEYFICGDSSIDQVLNTDSPREIECDKNICTSKEEAEAFLALMQLRQLRKAWIGDWNPTSETKLFAWIETSHCHYKTYVNYGTQECSRVLSFPTRAMAEDFLNCFKDLCEIAKPLL